MKMQRKEIWKWYDDEGETFLFRIVTGDRL